LRARRDLSNEDGPRLQAGPGGRWRAGHHAPEGAKPWQITTFGLTGWVSMTLWRILVVIGLLAGFAPPAQAQDQALSAADRGAIRQTIQDQVAAFRRDDDDAAFGYASPTIQTMFGTSTI